MTEEIVKLALMEDIGSGDITAALIPDDKQACAKIISRQPAVICGTKIVEDVFQQIDNKVEIDWKIKDGDSVSTDTTLCLLRGPARALLSGERTALNFLQTLSGTATLTRQFAAEIKHTKAQLLDTRKTIPGLREAQKHAVVCGGGKNHRHGLYDAILIKENHIAMSGDSVTNIVLAARDKYPDKTIEVEVKNLTELKEALNLPVDIIMLDNFTLQNIKEAVKLRADKNIKLEVSGGVNILTLKNIAETGVDFISVGILTKMIISVDLSLLFL